MKKVYKISGLDCPSCSLVIESDLADAGIKSKCDYVSGTLEIDEKRQKKAESILKKLGYQLRDWSTS